MKLKSLFAALLCSAVVPALAGDIELTNGTHLVVNGSTTNGATLYVGRYDDANSLTITNGGSVVADAGFIGKNSDNNTLLITGTNSSLHLVESLEIGKSGENNTLILKEGGWASIGTTNGIAGAISVGDTNGTASLAIGNGSTASADFLYVGTSAHESGTVTLTGNNTELIISDTAYMGQVGSNNTVSIFNGSTLTVSNLLQIGSATSSNNVLNINSGGEALIVGSVDVQNPGANQVNINSGGQLTYTGNANLDHADENGFNFKSGSTLEIGGALQFDKMDSGVSVILNGSLNTNLVSSWDTGATEMYVGENSDNNTLTIKEGATATAGGSTAHIGEYSRNNAVKVTGTGSVFTVNGQLIAGMQGDNNSLAIAEGGNATINNDLRVGLQSAASGNSVTVTGTNSSLTVGGNAIIGEAGTQNSLTVTDATLDIGQTFYIGKSGANNSALVTGSNAVVTVGGDLLVGLTSDDNELKIESGAHLVLSGNALIGTNGANNSITVTGTNSLLDIDGSLTLGNLVETNSNTGNTLAVFETARVAIGDNLSAHNGSLIQIKAGSQITVGGDYWQDETSELAIFMSTNGIGTVNLAVTGEAHFASNTTITVYDDGTATNEFEQVAVSSSGLYIGTNSATTALLNDTNTLHFVNHLLDINGMVTNNNIVLKTVRLSIAEKSGLEGTSLEPLANEIDGMALSGNTNAITMRNILGLELDTDEERNKAMNDSYGEKTSSAPMHNVINMGIGGIANQLTVRGDNTRARQAGSESTAPEPVGAKGPHTPDQELQGWIAGYGSWADRSASDGFEAYDANLSGFIIGVDLAVSENLLVGLAGGSNSGSVDKNNGANGDTKTTYGAIYASLGTQDWFFDASMIYGASSIDNTLGDVFDTTAAYDAQNVAFYFGGGKEISGQYLIFTPQASLLANYYKQDAYDEESTVVGRSVDSFDALYVRSSIGCNLGFYMAMGEVTLKPEIRAHWLHEFNASEEDLSYTLIGGTGGLYNMVLQAPEEDVLKIGAGIAAKLSEYLELRADLDTQQASGYSDYTLLGSLRYQF